MIDEFLEARCIIYKASKLRKSRFFILHCFLYFYQTSDTTRTYILPDSGFVLIYQLLL